MTRINLVPPRELADQHLIAEYREIFMVGSSLQRSLKSKNWTNTLNTLPKEFTLNTGHVKFFYNKGLFLSKRYKDIVSEMKGRGMKPNERRIFKEDQWPRLLYNDWRPSKRDMDIVRSRILEKINLKPNWYRWSKSV